MERWGGKGRIGDKHSKTPARPCALAVQLRTSLMYSVRAHTGGNNGIFQGFPWALASCVPSWGAARAVIGICNPEISFLSACGEGGV